MRAGELSKKSFTFVFITPTKHHDKNKTDEVLQPDDFRNVNEI
jgi:hypothetical protein